MRYNEEFTLQGCTLRIRPFTAFDGVYAFLFGVRRLMPLLNTLEEDPVPEGEGALPIQALGREELVEIQTLCLRQVDVRLEAGWTPLYRGDLFAVEAFETAPKACLLLCLKALRLLMQDFFTESA